MDSDIPAVEDTYIPRRFRPLEFVRKVREDQLSVLVPEMFDRRLLSGRTLRLRWFVANWPDYIERVLAFPSYPCRKCR